MNEPTFIPVLTSLDIIENKFSRVVKKKKKIQVEVGWSREFKPCLVCYNKIHKSLCPKSYNIRNYNLIYNIRYSSCTLNIKQVPKLVLRLTSIRDWIFSGPSATSIWFFCFFCFVFFPRFSSPFWFVWFWTWKKKKPRDIFFLPLLINFTRHQIPSLIFTYTYDEVIYTLRFKSSFCASHH